MTIRFVFKTFLRDESGATAIEYGLIAALIAVGLIGGARAFSGSLNDLFGGVDSDVSQAFDN